MVQASYRSPDRLSRAARRISGVSASASGSVILIGTSCSADVPLTWDLPACEMSRMAHGGFGLEVDPHVVMEESRQALSSVELDQPDEVDWTQVWRHEQLLALGFDVVRASLMADDAGVDLAQARKLVALGCPLETASRILL